MTGVARGIIGLVRAFRLLAVLTGAVVLFPLGSSARVTVANTWAGVWNSDFGKMTLDAGGSGKYEGFNPGTISGHVTGNVDEGTWSQPGDPPKKGFNTGVWAYETGGCGSACGWNGT